MCLWGLLVKSPSSLNELHRPHEEPSLQKGSEGGKGKWRKYLWSAMNYILVIFLSLNSMGNKNRGGGYSYTDRQNPCKLETSQRSWTRDTQRQNIQKAWKPGGGGHWCGGIAQKSKGKAWEAQCCGHRKGITLTLFNDPGENEIHLVPIW